MMEILQVQIKKREKFSTISSLVFTPKCTTNIPYFNKREVKDYIESFDITEEGVRKKLGKLNAEKSAGLHGHHPRVLKELQNQLVQPLKMIFTKSLDEGYLQPDWHEANAISLFKKEQKLKGTKSRPIHLTSVISKCFEALVRGAFIDHSTEMTCFLLYNMDSSEVDPVSCNQLQY